MEQQSDARLLWSASSGLRWESCGVALTIGQNITKTILLSPKQALILVIFASPLPWVPAHGPNKNHVNDTKNDTDGRETHTNNVGCYAPCLFDASFTYIQRRAMAHKSFKYKDHYMYKFTCIGLTSICRYHRRTWIINVIQSIFEIVVVATPRFCGGSSWCVKEMKHFKPTSHC